MFVQCKPAANVERFGINTDHIVEWRIDARSPKEAPDTMVDVLEVRTVLNMTYLFDLRNPKNQLLARVVTGDYELVVV